MAEPSITSTAIATTAGITAAALIPGVDANAVVGAFCGATLFVVSSRELGLGTRAVYLLISFEIGYLGGPAILSPWIEHSAVSAFLGSATAVTAGLRAIDLMKRLDLLIWFRGGK